MSEFTAAAEPNPYLDFATFELPPDHQVEDALRFYIMRTIIIANYYMQELPYVMSQHMDGFLRDILLLLPQDFSPQAVQESRQKTFEALYQEELRQPFEITEIVSSVDGILPPAMLRQGNRGRVSIIQQTILPTPLPTFPHMATIPFNFVAETAPAPDLDGPPPPPGPHPLAEPFTARFDPESSAFKTPNVQLPACLVRADARDKVAGRTISAAERCVEIYRRGGVPPEMSRKARRRARARAARGEDVLEEEGESWLDKLGKGKGREEHEARVKLRKKLLEKRDEAVEYITALADAADAAEAAMAVDASANPSGATPVAAAKSMEVDPSAAPSATSSVAPSATSSVAQIDDLDQPSTSKSRKSRKTRATAAAEATSARPKRQTRSSVLGTDVVSRGLGTIRKAMSTLTAKGRGKTAAGPSGDASGTLPVQTPAKRRRSVSSADDESVSTGSVKRPARKLRKLSLKNLKN